MTRFIGSIIGVFAFAAFGLASNCHVQRVVVQQHHVAPVVAVQQYYPYAIGYNPAGELAEAVKLLIEDNRQMRSELIQAYKSNIGGGPIPLKEGISTRHPAAQASCVSCHDASASKAKGDGITFYKDGILIDTPENVGRMVEAVTEKGTMPRGVKWGAQEKLDFLRSVVVRTAESK